MDEDGNNNGNVILSYKDPQAAHSVGSFFNDYNMRGHRIKVSMDEKLAPRVLTPYSLVVVEAEAIMVEIEVERVMGVVEATTVVDLTDDTLEELHSSSCYCTPVLGVGSVATNIHNVEHLLIYGAHMYFI
eukprot:Gb_21602 [translate_table: standard]